MRFSTLGDGEVGRGLISGVPGCGRKPEKAGKQGAPRDQSRFGAIGVGGDQTVGPQFTRRPDLHLNCKATADIADQHADSGFPFFPSQSDQSRHIISMLPAAA